MLNKNKHAAIIKAKYIVRITQRYNTTYIKLSEILQVAYGYCIYKEYI